MESVILGTPALYLGYILAAAIALFDQKSHSAGYFLPVVSVLVCVVTTTFAYLLGASVTEICIVLAVFLLISLRAFGGRQDK